jgi:2-oxoglutarate ferredoxin oxidoreductase subunit alpha
MTDPMATPTAPVSREARDSVVIRFAGDSGDGMQVTGSQFTVETALAGNDLATFPDFPAEIRAPAGTTFGVSAFQIHFGRIEVLTPGDEVDVLVCMNPAAMAVNLKDLRAGGLVIADTGAFTPRNLEKAGFRQNPLEDDTLSPYRALKLDITKLTLDAVKPFELGQKDALRCRNMWTLGLLLWMYGRDKQATVDGLAKKFAKKPEIANANIAAVNAGHAYGETVELGEPFPAYTVPKAEVPAGTYRTVSGTEAIAWGLVAGLKASGLGKMVFCGYPITPASAILHTLAGLKPYGVITHQSEDEIAAVCSAIGASYAGSLGVTATSGPGMALKTEAIGLAIAAELPLVIVNAQRAGPSTGLPTKTEQSDLFQAVYGRNGDAPLVVLAATTPADGFEMAVEAVRIALTYMTPVILLTDGFLVNAAEPWRLPDLGALPKFPVTLRTDPEGFHPFLRDQKLARNWAVPGTPGLEHRVGGIERSFSTGHISYDPENHDKMTKTRAAKVRGVQDDIPLQELNSGPAKGKLAVVGWGSTYGAIEAGLRQAREEGYDAAHIQLRYLNPFPRNLGALLRNYERILVPEMNNGQLVTILRSTFLVDAEGLDKVTGKPFKSAEVAAAVRTRMGG